MEIEIVIERLRRPLGLPCRHKLNYEVINTVSNHDGTPWTTFTCRDCGFQDSGHVHADETWKQEVVTVKSGKRVFSNVWGWDGN